MTVPNKPFAVSAAIAENGGTPPAQCIPLRALSGASSLPFLLGNLAGKTSGGGSPPAPPAPPPPSPPPPPPPPPPPVTATVTPGTLSQTISGAGTATTGAATINPSSGVTPYSYVWTKQSGANLSLSGANSQSTTFAAALNPGDSINATYRGTVIDSYGTSAYGDVSITLSCTFAALTGTASPTSVNGVALANGKPGRQVTSTQTNVTPNGGSGSYNFNWLVINVTSDSGQSYSISAVTPTASATRFSTAVQADDTVYGTGRCTLTDTAGNSAIVDVPITLVCGA